MISIVVCCHSVKLCTHAAQAFRLQQDKPVLQAEGLYRFPYSKFARNTLAPGWFWRFSAKKHLNAHGFVDEYLRSCSL